MNERIDVLAVTGRQLSTRRAVQLSDLCDRAMSERVRYFCNAITAKQISNRGACRYFADKARRWERIRQAATRQLAADALARVGAP